jgi:3-oxoacyl-[acyl-carrier-protein] synthase II
VSRSQRQAVITGVGVVSPFGVGTAALLSGLATGASAVGPIRHFSPLGLPVQVAGEVPLPTLSAATLRQLWTVPPFPPPDPQLLQTVEWAGQSGALRDRKVGFALLAAREAWCSAAAGEAERSAPLLIGLGLELGLLDELAGLLTGEGESLRLDFERDLPTPLLRLRTPVDTAARLVQALLGLRGPLVVNASACAAGALAVAEAAAMIVRGQADIALCGASDSMVNPLGLGGMARLGAPSPRHTADACRPFDRRRDGLVVGEGAAMFVLEEAGRAERRGATIYGRLLGWGNSQDGYRATAPLPDGSAAARAMQKALARADLRPADIGYINAHGTGTPLNDPAEARAIRSALGAATDRLVVSSIKGAIGHLMAAAGAVELAACLLCFAADLLPGTAHLHDPDPDCPIPLLGPSPQPARVAALLTNSFGFGGQNCCLAVGRPL